LTFGKVIAILLIVCGLFAVAAVASLLFGITAEDGRNWQRLSFCLLSIVLAAVPTAVVYVGEEIVRDFSDGMWNHRTASVVAIVAFGVFTLFGVAGSIPRRRKKPNKSPEPTPTAVTPRANE
jgi:hypothetical protein